jgi:hypothetical protein
MTPHNATTQGNARKLARLEAILAETLIETLRCGFFGTARIEVSVQDGTIQHIRRIVDRIEK